MACSSSTVNNYFPLLSWVWYCGPYLAALLPLQWNPVYTDTKGACQNVRIIGVSVLSGLFFKEMYELAFRRGKQNCP